MHVLAEGLDSAQQKLVDGLVQGITGKRPAYGSGPITLVMGEPLSKALLGDRYTTLEACNGVVFREGGTDFIPTVSPEALMGHKDGTLLFGAAITNPRNEVLAIPPPLALENNYPLDALIAVDTEGTPEDPICLTWADSTGRYLAPNPTLFWDRVYDLKATVVYHNAVWDWGVMEALGIAEPWKVAYTDTLQRVYGMPGEPKGLKDLGYRYLGIKMPSFEDVVMPHYNRLVLEEGKRIVDAHTTTTTHTSKGKLRKKPIVKVDEDYLPIARPLKTGNVKLLAERLGWWDGQGFGATGSRPPSLRDVPYAEMLEYATLDAWVTLLLHSKL